jgi:stress-induced morphogen
MVTIRGKSDDSLQALASVLAKYGEQHPNADIVVYRQNSASIRARIVDPDFAGENKADRHDDVWGFVKDLPEDQQSEISLLLLLTPEEVGMSFANYEFDHSIRSQL